MAAINGAILLVTALGALCRTWCLWGMSQPRGAGRWMLDQVSAVRASACVFQAKGSARSALCYFFSPPNSAIFLLRFAFHLLGCVY